MMKKIVPFMFIFICCIISPHMVRASTDVSSDITSDTTWDISGSPYVLTKEIRILEGVTLTVDPGVVVENATGRSPFFTKLTVFHGHIVANGTEDKHITFHNFVIEGTTGSIALAYADALRVEFMTRSTVDIAHSTLGSLSVRDSTIANVTDTTIDSTASASSFSVSVFVNVQSVLHFTNGTIRNTSNLGRGLLTEDNVIVTLTNILVEADSIGVSDTVDSFVTIENCIIRNSKTAGIYVQKHPTEPWDKNQLVVHNSQITHNGHGIEIFNLPRVVDIAGNSFTNNTIAVYKTGTYIIPIGENWWGSSTGPKSTQYNPNGLGESISDTYSFSSWLHSDPFSTVETVVPPAKTPVILIPGIASTKLIKANDPNAELWPHLAGLIASTSDSFLDYLALDANGDPRAEAPVVTGDIVRGYVGVHVFDGLINSLFESGYTENKDLFVFPYDWRLSVATNARLLKQKISDVMQSSGSTSVNLIAHSMGGLVAKEYIATEGDANINKLIFLGTPHLGAPKAFTMLQYGDNLGASILGFSLLNRKRMFVISQNMPSVYDLLPSMKYVDDPIQGLRYIRDLVATSLSATGANYLDYTATKNVLVQSGRNESLFAQAEDLHRVTDSMTLPEDKTYNYVGCGKSKTVGSITLRKKLLWTSAGRKFVDDYDLGYVNGDDTVPLTSASLSIDSAHQLYIKGASHSEIPSISGVPASIVSVLGGTQGGDSSSSITRDKTVCSVSGTSISKHSPVRMDIYDEAGNHTGPLDDGSIEYGIDGVTWNEYHDAFEASGMTVQYFALDKTGNAEEVHLISVPEKTQTVGETISHQGGGESEHHSSAPVGLIQSIGDKVSEIPFIENLLPLPQKSLELPSDTVPSEPVDTPPVVINQKSVSTIVHTADTTQTKSTVIDTPLAAHASGSGGNVKAWVVMGSVVLLGGLWLLSRR